MSAWVEVAVGLPVMGTYTYAVPAALVDDALVGAQVLVPFGHRAVAGVIVDTHAERPGRTDPDAIKPITSVLATAPRLEPEIVELTRWVADYYEAPPGEVVRAALPVGSQVASATRLCLTEAGRTALAGSGPALSTAARRLLAQVGAAPRGLALGGTSVAARGELVAAGLVSEAETRRARVKARTIDTVRLGREPTELEQVQLRRAPKRAALIERLRAAPGPVDRSSLAAEPGGLAALRALEHAGLVVRGQREVARELAELGPSGQSGELDAAGSRAAGAPPASPLPPTEGQRLALTAIIGAARAGGFHAFLLHGITGSGKTEVYLQVIADALARGRGALVLVPEIALTPQLAARFRARFGDRVAVLHSGLGDAERYEQWRRLRAGEAVIALGARSAVFAPVVDLGVVVVDEEHDASFKQEEGVRYHARDVALVRAQRTRGGCVAVLGSATPSLETYQNALAGRHVLLELPARPGARPLPEVEIIDLRRYRADAETQLTAPLAEAIEKTLAAGEQVILFLNRRGFASFVVCVGCGHAFRCRHCSVSLTYHRSGDRMVCHYCGHTELVPTECPRCRGADTIMRLGTGTERIEVAICARFRGARVARLDRDSAAGRGLTDVLNRMAAGEIDILVGTQMVTKGHDFPGVTLVGVLSADQGLAFPDFRAGERTFQLLAQVAGRAGRGDRPGRVLVQTYSPDHPAVVSAKTHDYRAFFAAELAVRTELDYPPRGRVVAIRLDGEREADVRALSDALGERARELCREVAFQRVIVSGPAEAPLSRLKGRVRWHLWARCVERSALRAFVRRLCAGRDGWPGQVRVTVDVDPISSL
jgi:primosomal protein N' (replication factor Y)